jgi:hypothetical protein
VEHHIRKGSLKNHVFHIGGIEAHGSEPGPEVAVHETRPCRAQNAIHAVDGYHRGGNDCGLI